MISAPLTPTGQLAELAKPFPADAISWRVGSTNKDKTRGLALAYIDARDVMDRLDKVFGPENWRDEYQEVSGFLICKLWLKIAGEWTWKCDGAGKTDVEAEKGMVSDSFKRAAVKWGVGRYLYNLDSPWVAINEFRQIDKGEYSKLQALLNRDATKSAPATQSQQASARGAASPAGDAVGAPDRERGDKSRSPNPDTAAITKAVTDVFPDAVPQQPRPSLQGVADRMATVAPARAAVADVKGKKTSGEIRAAATRADGKGWQDKERTSRSKAAMTKLLSGPINTPGVIPLNNIEADLPEVGGTKSRHRLSAWERLLKQNEGLMVEADRVELQKRIDGLSKAIDASFHDADPKTGEVAA